MQRKSIIIQILLFSRHNLPLSTTLKIPIVIANKKSMTTKSPNTIFQGSNVCRESTACVSQNISA